VFRAIFAIWRCYLTFPFLSEAQVDRAGKDLAAVLWSQDYRRVLISPNAKPPRIS